MSREAEIQARLIWVGRQLSSGQAVVTVREAGRTNADVARVCEVSTASVWRWFNEKRVPRRAAALRLAMLLQELEVINRVR
jgi:hypothetical protein